MVTYHENIAGVKGHSVAVGRLFPPPRWLGGEAGIVRTRTASAARRARHEPVSQERESDNSKRLKMKESAKSEDSGV
jgi:hypothetical protein